MKFKVFHSNNEMQLTIHSAVGFTKNEKIRPTCIDNLCEKKEKNIQMFYYIVDCNVPV